MMLDQMGICISAGSACNSETIQPSKVLKAIGLSDEDANSTVRISINEMNTRDEVKSIARQLGTCVAALRK